MATSTTGGTNDTIRNANGKGGMGPQNHIPTVNGVENVQVQRDENFGLWMLAQPRSRRKQAFGPGKNMANQNVGPNVQNRFYSLAGPSSSNRTEREKGKRKAHHDDPNNGSELPNPNINLYKNSHSISSLITNSQLPFAQGTNAKTQGQARASRTTTSKPVGKRTEAGGKSKNLNDKAAKQVVSDRTPRDQSCRLVIISADREFNYYILKQVGTLVDTLSLDTFAEVFDQINQSLRKYSRNLNHFGVEALKGKLIPKMEDFIRKTLRTWSSKDTIEGKGASIKITLAFATKQLVSSDIDNSLLKLSNMFNDLVEGLMSFPVNIPGTTHHKCKQVRETVGNVLKKRLCSSPDQNREEDLLDHLIKDMDTEKFLNEDFIVQLIFSLLFVTSDSISTTMALAFKLLRNILKCWKN
ncbi:hypothetical protein LguiB_035616 [Lonicera macranthoides]